MPDDLQWARWPWNRCAARRERRPSDSDWGRCELRRHSPEIDHALERGMYVLRWSTRAVEEIEILHAGDLVNVILPDGPGRGVVKHLGSAQTPLVIVVMERDGE